METIYLSGSWWITGVPDCCDVGPYKTKADAEEIRRGLERTYKYMDEPGFITSDPATR